MTAISQVQRRITIAVQKKVSFYLKKFLKAPWKGNITVRSERKKGISNVTLNPMTSSSLQTCITNVILVVNKHKRDKNDTLAKCEMKMREQGKKEEREGRRILEGPNKDYEYVFS